MSWKSLLLILLCLTAVKVFCQNQMSLMTTIYGEFSGDKFGSHMVAMDYNGDGLDDLIVLSDMWNETGVLDEEHYLGKLYFYWGGPVFDGIPDLVLEGQQQNDYTGYNDNYPGICNAGDMNGDGIDDLAITRSYDGISGTRKSLDLYLGRSVPQSVPDYVITYPQTALSPRWLGDINHDGKDDLAINGYCYDRYPPFCYIWTDLDSSPFLFRTNSFDGGLFLNGVGDVNSDGYADSFMTTPLSPYSTYVNAIMYYGDANVSMSDSLVISEMLYRGTTNARPLGDINGDDFADFIGLFDVDYHYIWLGSTEIDSIPDLQLSLNTDDHDMTLFIRGERVYAVHGDMNGDGYSDFVCSDSGANGWDGQAGLWLGGQNANATVDLVLNPPPDYWNMNFGHAKAVGDFNGDGFDDIALSCPWWGEGSSFTFPGRVYVYAGNAQLEDTTVGNDDPVVPPVSADDWNMDVYPNPSPKGHGNINVKLQGESYLHRGQYSYQLFNIRGQQIKDGVISDADVINRRFNIAYDGLPAGIYQVAVLYNSEIKGVKRIVVY